MSEEKSTVEIVVDNVSKEFVVDGAPLEAIQDISFTLPAGGFATLVGPSGSGKSTLLRMLADLEVPTSGTVSLGGKSPRERVRAHEVGMGFQDSALLPWRNVRRNIDFAREVAGLPPRPELVEELLDLVGLPGFATARPAQLSGGMRQRVSLARALVLEPRLLLLDEPFGALDEFTRDALNLELQRIWMHEAITTVMVTHSISEAVFLSDTIVVMSARPATVLALVDVPFERPRSPELLTSPEFFELCASVTAMLKASHANEAVQNSNPGGR